MLRKGRGGKLKEAGDRSCRRVDEVLARRLVRSTPLPSLSFSSFIATWTRDELWESHVPGLGRVTSCGHRVVYHTCPHSVIQCKQ